MKIKTRDKSDLKHTRVHTGQRCPTSGIWKVKGSHSTTAPIAKGNVMPPYDGKAVTWKLVQLA